MTDLESLSLLVFGIFLVVTGIAFFVWAIVYERKQIFFPLWSWIRFRKTKRVFDSLLIQMVLLCCVVPCLVFGLHCISLYFGLSKAW